MGGHERERLSAYLDGELPPAEQAAVALHLGACAECAARLAELAAVDESVAALPAEPPASYFDTLPARVRGRLDRAPRRTRSLPAWAWAAAAALLLAVTTPLVLRQRPDLASVPPAQQAPTPASLPAAADGERRSDAPATRAPRAEAPRATQEADALLPRPAPEPGAPAPKKRETAFAAAPPPAAPNATPALTAKAVEREDAAVPLGEEPKAAGAPVAGARNEGFVAAAAEEKLAQDALAASAEGLAAQASPARGRVAAPAAGALASRPPVLQAEWERLEAARPSSAAEWRRLREDWQRLAARDPDVRRADEARVRAIEADFAAWRAGGDTADELRFRADAAAYLERQDAAQRERVKGLLR